MLVYMSSNSLRASLDLKRAEKKEQVPLWRLALSAFVFSGTFWAAQLALRRLRMMGQETSDILWEALLFAAMFALVTTVTNLLRRLIKREDTKRESTVVD